MPAKQVTDNKIPENDVDCLKFIVTKMTPGIAYQIELLEHRFIHIHNT